MHHQSYRASPPSSEYGLRRTTAAQQSSLGYGQPFNAANVNGIGGNTMTSQPRVNGGVPGNMGNVNMQILAMQQQQNQLELELQMQQIRMQSLQLQEQIMQQQQAAQEQAYRNENAARRVMSIPTSSAYHPHSQHSHQLLQQQQQQQDEADEALRAQQRRSALLNLRNRVASATSPGPTKTTFGDHQTALPKSTSAYFPRNLERSSTTSSASSGAASPTLSSPPAVILSKPGDSYPFVESDGGSEDEREREMEKIHRSMLSDGSEEAAKNFRRASAGAAVLGLRNKVSSPPPPEVKTKSASIPIPNSASSGTLNAAAKPFSFPSKPLLSSSPKNSPSPKGSGVIELQQQGLGYGHPHSSATTGGQSAFSPAVHASLNGISHAHSQSNSSVGSRSSSRAGVAPGPGGNSRSKVEKITTIRQPRGPAQESEMASKNFSARIRKRAIGLLQGQGTNEDGAAVGANSSVGGLGLPGGLGGLAAAAERRASRRLSAMTAVGA